MNSQVLRNVASCATAMALLVGRGGGGKEAKKFVVSEMGYETGARSNYERR